MSRLALRSPANWRAFDSWSFWIAALVALLLLLMWMFGRGPNAMGCCGAMSASTAGKVAAAAPAAAGASWGTDGKVTLTGVVKDAATKKAIVDSAIAKYGATNVIDQLTINATAASKVVLTGTVFSADEKKARGDWAASIYGPTVTIDNQIDVQLPPGAAAASGPKPPAVKVYFETAKTDIDGKDRDAMGTIITYLKANASAKAVISGFHDPRGDKAANEELAKNRAKTVREVLRSAGIEEGRIVMQKPVETTGSGDNAEARRVEVSIE
jgi:outer membrane protein OmpA-like peptidoglycan-associated protein